MLRVAIIGAGHVGTIRAQVITRSSSARVQLVADAEFLLAQRLAASVGAEAAPDPHAAVMDSNIDVVVVSTPTKFHRAFAVAALQAGKHVLCEKPLGRSVCEAEEIAEAAEHSGRILKTGFNYRYMAHVRKAKQLLQADAIGEVMFLRSQYGHGGRPRYEDHWCTDRDLSGGGVLLEQGIHILDLFRHLVGEPAHIMADTSRYFWGFPEVEDNCFLLLKTKSSKAGQIHVSWTQWINIFSLEIFGRDGYLHLTGRDGHYGPQRLVWGKRRADHSRPQEEVFDFPPPEDSWAREWDDFAGAIYGGQLQAGHVDDGRRSLELVEGAYESSGQQGWVDLSQFRQRLRSTA
jgi:predicted dehydrogenase